MSTNTKLIIDCNTGTQELVAMTSEEIVAKEAHTTKTLEAKAVLDAEKLTATNLKASAKAKLIAGEALTEDEANTIVL